MTFSLRVLGMVVGPKVQAKKSPAGAGRLGWWVRAQTLSGAVF
jgi:hypothetical protein